MQIGELNADRRRRDRRVLVNFGRPFTIYKFRTMVMDAERGAPPMWARENDPRITPVGRILRRSRIDELPQFLNVLRGDMSIVGPRPERAYFIGRIEKELPDFHLRLRTKPGITGLAQVELGYTNTDEGLRQKLHLDLEYIHTLCFWTDAKILLRTVFVVLTGRGAC
jgi:lipopolysaccharide/colanic/teichoic acid biosynthesis glycosyltransferase